MKELILLTCLLILTSGKIHISSEPLNFSFASNHCESIEEKVNDIGEYAL